MKKSLLLFLIAFTTVFTSCKKTENDEDNTENTTGNILAATTLGTVAKENSNSEAAFNDIYNDVSQNDETPSSNAGLKSAMAEGVTISVEKLNGTENFPRRVTIDYKEGYTNLFQVRKSGKIIATYTGRYRDSGSVITVVLENFSRNGVSIEGSKTITNLGTNENGNIAFSISIKNATFTDSSGTRTWESERIREWTEGSDTQLNWIDDVYSITGTAQGKTIKQNDYTISITDALIYPLNCGSITQGLIDYSVMVNNTNYSAEVDYGNGECDKTATLTVFGKETTIIHR